jgi:hypothetical protein
MNKNIKRLIYLIAITGGVLSLVREMNTVISILLFLSASAYLFLGWMLLNPEHNRKFDFLYFILGYIFSTAFIALLFKTRNYPMEELLLYVSAAMLVVSVIVLVLIDRARKKPVIENILKIIFLLGLVITGMVI